MAAKTSIAVDELYEEASEEISEDISNKNLVPMPIKSRTWRMLDYFNLWIGIAVCIPTWMLGSSMIAAGLNIWHILIIMITSQVAMAAVIVLISVPGARYGIPFPVQLRSAFGYHGAKIAALLRGLLGTGWYGIQIWIGASALNLITIQLFPSWQNVPNNIWYWFVVFFFATAAILYFSPPYKELKWIRFLCNLSAPFLLTVGVVYVIAFWVKAGTIGEMALKGMDMPAGAFWKMFLMMWISMMGYWSTVGVNVADFTRYAKTQKDQMIGQLLGICVAQTLYVLVGVVVTSAGASLYGKVVWDPVELMSMIDVPWLAFLSLVFVILATLATNVPGNAVATNMSLINLLPKKMSWQLASLITAVLSIILQPWRLLANYETYVFTWLIGYQCILGPLMGILFVDYYISKNKKYVLRDLYEENGIYRYDNGYYWKGFVALIVGAAFTLSGAFVESLSFCYDNGFIVAMVISAVVYLVLTKGECSVEIQDVAKVSTSK